MLSNVTWHTEFAYDGLSRRIEAREYTNGSLAKTHQYVYDGWNVVLEYTHTPTPPYTQTNSYTWGLDISLSFEGAGGIGSLLALSPLPGGAGGGLFYFYDGNGNVTDVLDDSDTLAAHYEYDPFGNVLVADGPHADQPFQWSAKMHHEPSGLVYYGYRFLKPDIGRWLNRDPIEERGGENVYALAGNNPVSPIDPFGFLVVVGPYWDYGSRTSHSEPGKTVYTASWRYQIRYQLRNTCYIARDNLNYTATIYIWHGAQGDASWRQRIVSHEYTYVQRYDGPELEPAERMVNTAPTGWMCCPCARAWVDAIEKGVLAQQEYALYKSYQWDASDYSPGPHRDRARRLRDIYQESARRLLERSRDAFAAIRSACDCDRR